ncbi:hypothetical protein HWV07_07765 [Natronomonas salina]|uniref:hypothetical protein n=1 Tax=Natronomonas salina TaxID=1710540 RepID=UPI0015B43BA8|nr:hypothetical protein [Natronomonas salina]QLD88930.1 hypothetical protein HWV07_07765 [Natronomonas salina]
MSDAETPDAERAGDDRPTWDDEYLETVGGRLHHNYDLEADYRVDGESFPLYGHMEIHSEKHFLHPALSFAHHESHEHLFVRRAERVTEADLRRLVDLGHELADRWIDPHEEHYSTEFTFVVIAAEIPENVRSFVADLDERQLLKYGFHGHYEVNLVVAAPEARDLVASDEADVEEAFRTWTEIERQEPGLLDLVARRLQL